MALAIKRPCAQPGCAELVERGRCAAHQREAYRQQDARRGSRQARGSGRAWDRLRLLILDRDQWLCQACRRRDACEVDHIVAKADGGSDAPSNLQSLCSDCHGLKTGREEAARGCGDRPRAVTTPRGGVPS